MRNPESDSTRGSGRRPARRMAGSLSAVLLALAVLAGCSNLPAETTGPSSTAGSSSVTAEPTDSGETTVITETPDTTESPETTAEPTPSPVPEPALGSPDFIYFILTDRFHDGDPGNNGTDTDTSDMRKRHGGDLAGIMEKLDYIDSLGATAIWITPVLENTPDGYHGYWINDFRAIDPHLGTLEELRELVDEAHGRDIKVLVDYVVNHTGYDSDILNDPEKADWFHEDKTIVDFSDREERENGWLAGLPDLDQENPEVRDYLIGSALWLIEETGIDGFRLDTVTHVPGEFWQIFTDAIRAEYPDFFFLGEAYSYQPAVIKYYQRNGIDGMLNYPIYEGLLQSFSRVSDFTPLRKAMETDQSLGFHEYNGIFFDNHDNTRLMTYLLRQSSGPEAAPQRYIQALTAVMTYEGIPVLYYGSEIGMEGGEDPDNRRPMEFPSPERPAGPYTLYLETVQKLGELRASGALEAGDGDFELLETDPAILAWRHGEVLTVLNASPEVFTAELVLDGSWTDALGGGDFDLTASSGQLDLDGFGILVLVRQP